ncbi:MAG: hypothetical protein GF346_07730 [Candidatus Eisenbacteria bacterium]|nr:hypothetical protein [Candidatus Latescibacterota bacterium]MBD3302322.1 hypothetical protein [Candidatus Eisenbacteria bacterium]
MKGLWHETRGFLIGLLVIAVPVGAYLLLRSSPEDPEQRGASDRPPAEARQAPPPGPARTPVEPAEPIDRTRLREAGAAIPGPTPLPEAGQVEKALADAERWLHAREIDPFGGTGVDSLRLFALEVQCWDRLWWSEHDPERRAALAREVERRLHRFLDPEGIAARLRSAEGSEGGLEFLILAVLCREHGVAIGPISPLLIEVAGVLSAARERIPPAMRPFVMGLIERLDLPGAPPDGTGEEAARYGPYRVTTMGSSETIALTQRILSATDLARRFHGPLDPESRENLRLTLPNLALSNALLRNRELAADLLSCLALVGLTDTYGYREGMSLLLERQSDDGGFGDPSGNRNVRLAPTAAALTALSLERVRARRGS